MERGAADVLKDALALPPHVRGALIDSLIESLDQSEDATADSAWHEEIERRVEQIDTGSVNLIAWGDARFRLRSRFPG
jgi:putative addiction module component (TIGR02574 family)